MTPSRCSGPRSSSTRRPARTPSPGWCATCCGAGAPTRRGRGESSVPASLAALGVTSREADVLGLLVDGATNSKATQLKPVEDIAVGRTVDEEAQHVGLPARHAEGGQRRRDRGLPRGPAASAHRRAATGRAPPGRGRPRRPPGARRARPGAAGRGHPSRPSRRCRGRWSAALCAAKASPRRAALRLVQRRGCFVETACSSGGHRVGIPERGGVGAPTGDGYLRQRLPGLGAAVVGHGP